MLTNQSSTVCLRTAVLMAGLVVVSASSVFAAGVVAAAEPVAQMSETPSAESKEVGAGKGSTGQENQVVLYYFHGARRCKTCLTIEANAREVVESEFASELESGALAWKVVNYDDPENEHFINDFGLTSSSLVVVETNNGDRVQHDVLQETWSLVRDKPKFDEYVRVSILGYLE